MFNFSKIFSLSLVLFAVSVYISFAQIPGIGEAISFRVFPENPRPNQVVTIEIESFSVDLDRADSITWSINGKTEARGAGVKQIQFEAGELGSRSVVDVTAFGTEIGTINESITIMPTEVDLLWEAKTYTPVLYKGKALPSSDAEITVVAIPQFVTSSGKKLDSEDLVFTWKKDGKVLGNYSGRGKDSIKIIGPKIFNRTRIQAEVSSLGNSLQGMGVVSISSVLPTVLFYEDDPVLGMKYEKAIWSTVELFDEEMTITAHPYFFSSKDRISPDIEYSWKVNGTSVEGSPEDESSIVLRQVGQGEGEASISLSLQNLNKILQSAQEDFSILFGRNNNTLFGF